MSEPRLRVGLVQDRQKLSFRLDGLYHLLVDDADQPSARLGGRWRVDLEGGSLRLWRHGATEPFAAGDRKSVV